MIIVCVRWIQLFPIIQKKRFKAFDFLTFTLVQPHVVTAFFIIFVKESSKYEMDLVCIYTILGSLSITLSHISLQTYNIAVDYFNVQYIRV